MRLLAQSCSQMRSGHVWLNKGLTIAVIHRSVGRRCRYQHKRLGRTSEPRYSQCAPERRVDGAEVGALRPRLAPEDRGAMTIGSHPHHTFPLAHWIRGSDVPRHLAEGKVLAITGFKCPPPGPQDHILHATEALGLAQDRRATQPRMLKPFNAAGQCGRAWLTAQPAIDEEDAFLGQGVGERLDERPADRIEGGARAFPPVIRITSLTTSLSAVAITCCAPGLQRRGLDTVSGQAMGTAPAQLAS